MLKMIIVAHDYIYGLVVHVAPLKVWLTRRWTNWLASGQPRVEKQGKMHQEISIGFCIGMGNCSMSRYQHLRSQSVGKFGDGMESVVAKNGWRSSRAYICLVGWHPFFEPIQNFSWVAMIPGLMRDSYRQSWCWRNSGITSLWCNRTTPSTSNPLLSAWGQCRWLCMEMKDVVWGKHPSWCCLTSWWFLTLDPTAWILLRY